VARNSRSPHNGLSSKAVARKQTSTGQTTIFENYKPKGKDMTAHNERQEENELMLVITRVFDAPREVVWRRGRTPSAFSSRLRKIMI
jgi:hypothetical protein